MGKRRGKKKNNRSNNNSVRVKRTVEKLKFLNQVGGGSVGLMIKGLEMMEPAVDYAHKNDGMSKKFKTMVKKKKKKLGGCVIS